MLRLLAEHEIATCQTDPGNCDISDELVNPGDPWATTAVCVAHTEETTTDEGDPR